MKRILIGTAVVVVVVGCLLAGCVYIGNQIMAGKPLPQEHKLADFTNDSATATVLWPNAEPWSFNLLVGVPIASRTNWTWEMPSPAFTGSVRVTSAEHTLIEEFSVKSENSQNCNWLTEHSLCGFILTWQQTNCLKTATQPGQTYHITVTIPNRPAEIRSLWMSYLQSAEQREREHRTSRVDGTR